MLKTQCIYLFTTKKNHKILTNFVDNKSLISIDIDSHKATSNLQNHSFIQQTNLQYGDLKQINTNLFTQHLKQQ